jgi:hypothetical protein
MQFDPSTIGFVILACGLLVSVLGWTGIGRSRRRLFDAQWGDLARYGGPVLACFGAMASFVQFNV